jgi:hypothetical protein
MIDKSRQEILQRLEVIEKQVRAIREAIGREEPVFPTEAEKKYAKRICLDCGKPIEEGRRNLRGLHEYCYKRVLRMIETDQLTEAAAIASGLIVPRQPGGRPPASESAVNQKVGGDKYAAEIAEMEAKGLGPNRGRGKTDPPRRPPGDGRNSGKKAR